MSGLRDRIAPAPFLDKRSSNMDQTIKKYSNGRVYIVDALDKEEVAEQEAQQSGTKKKRKRMSEHEEANTAIKDFFQKYTEYIVQDVGFPKDSEATDFYQFWKDESEDWDQDELVIIYYHGDAGWSGEDWRWHLSKDPHSVKVPKFTKYLMNSKADVMFLLDCYTPGNATKSWPRSNSYMEIYARPQQEQSRDGKVIRSDGDFTTALTDGLEDFVEQIKKKYRKSSELRSITAILGHAKRDEMTDKIRRPGLDQVDYKKNKRVQRFVIDPQLVRRTGKIEFFGKMIQDGKRSSSREQSTSTTQILNTSKEPEDEGIFMSDEDEL